MFSTQYQVKDLEKLKKDLDPKIVERANSAGANKAAQKLRTFVSKAIRQVYNVKASAISKRVELRRASRSTPVAELRYKGPRVGLVNFAPKAKKVTLTRKPRKGQKGMPWGRVRTGVTVKVRKDGSRKLVQSKPGFIAVGANNNEHIYYRTGKERNKLESALTWSLPEMVRLSEKEGAGSEKAYEDYAEQEYDLEFDRALRHFMSKA